MTMAEFMVSQRVTNRAAEGSTPSSVSKREQWRHIGFHDDVLRIYPHDEGYLSVSFEPHCPQCKRSHHPNVARSAGDDSHDRHCNHCKIRWSALFQPFSSCHGEPESVLRKLIHGLVTQRHTY